MLTKPSARTSQSKLLRNKDFLNPIQANHIYIYIFPIYSARKSLLSSVSINHLKIPESTICPTHKRIRTVIKPRGFGVAQLGAMELPFFEWNQICSGTDSESRRESPLVIHVMNRSDKRKRIRHGHVSDRWPIERFPTNACMRRFPSQNLRRVHPLRRLINTG